MEAETRKVASYLPFLAFKGFILGIQRGRIHKLFMSYIVVSYIAIYTWLSGQELQELRI